jgi:recombinational DNA repair protein RecR
MSYKKKIFYFVLLLVFNTICSIAQSDKKIETILITNFTIYEKENKLNINWTTNGAIATNFWKVQCSSDKIQFSTIAIVLGNDPLQQGDSYAYKQKIKSKEDIILYYRLCHTDANGNEEFSEILKPAK